MSLWWAGTGFKVTKLFHLSALVNDLTVLHEFYARVFGVTQNRTAPWFRDRFGSFTMIADVWIENLCADQNWETALRAYSHLVGEHWCIPGLYVTDMQDAIYQMSYRHGIRLTAMGTGAPITNTPQALWPRPGWPDEHHSSVTEAFTHPWDAGLMWVLVEFAPGTRTVDPRASPGWRYEFNPDDPLTIEYGSHHTIVVDDPAVSIKFLVDICRGKLLRTGDNAATGTRSSWVAVGEEEPVVLEIAQPVADGPARMDLIRAGNTLHSCVFKVRDLDKARTHLAGLGIRLETEHESLIVTHPGDCCGLRFGFTSQSIPDHPKLRL